MVSAPWCLLCGNIYLFNYSDCFTELQGHLEEGIKCLFARKRLSFKLYTFFFLKSLLQKRGPRILPRQHIYSFLPTWLREPGVSPTDLEGSRAFSTPAFCQEVGTSGLKGSCDKML